MQNVPQNTNLNTATVGNVYTAVYPTANPFGPGVQVRYLVDSQSIRIILPGHSDTFSVPEIAGANDGYVVRFEKKNGSGALSARLSVQVPLIAGVPLTYTRFGDYTYFETPGSSKADKHEQFVFGRTTANAEMPRTGSASYSTVLSGYVIAKVTDGSTTGFYNLNDTAHGATFNANFADMSVLTTLRLTATPVESTAATEPGDRDFGSLTGIGTIAANGPGFQGTFGTGVLGGFTGAFFGPSAQEMGYVFFASCACNGGYNLSGTVFGVHPTP